MLRGSDSRRLHLFWIAGAIAEVARVVRNENDAVGSAVLPHFQLVTVDGEALGARELGRPDWPPGSVIYSGSDESSLRVVEVLDDDEDDPERFKVLVVEEPLRFKVLVDASACRDRGSAAIRLGELEQLALSRTRG
jgi:hypothetical protein